MSIQHLTVPKFRSPRRLVTWMQVNGVRERVPSCEGVFFKKSSSPWDVVQYARQAGKLPAEMVALILPSPTACVDYAGLEGDETPDNVLDGAAIGGDACLIKLANKIHKRIPERLEKLIDTPDAYRAYVVETRKRVPEMEERILFSGRFPADEVATQVAIMIDNLSTGYGMPHREEAMNDAGLKRLLMANPSAVETYMNTISRRGMKLEPEFQEVFKGRGELLLKLAEHLRQRLSPDLENTWNEAGSLVQYTVRWVRQRLPENLEEVLIGNHKAACEYAFQVVRGFSSPRLSDRLHAFVLMKSFEVSDDANIKRYVAECDRIAGNKS